MYVDDILVLSHDMKPIMDGILAQFRLKEDSLEPPKQYLGATIKIPYVKAAVAEVVEDLDKQGLKLKGKAHQPYDSNYMPELDVTEELDDDRVSQVSRLYWNILLDD